MIKTIKVKKTLRLDELIKYIFDSGIEDKTYGVTVFNTPSEVRISGSGNIKINGYINKHTTFTVEMEDEITEDTAFDELVISDGKRTALAWNCSIKDCEHPSNKMFYTHINGKLQLIWERE